MMAGAVEESETGREEGLEGAEGDAAAGTGERAEDERARCKGCCSSRSSKESIDWIIAGQGKPSSTRISFSSRPN